MCWFYESARAKFNPSTRTLIINKLEMCALAHSTMRRYWRQLCSKKFVRECDRDREKTFETATFGRLWPAHGNRKRISSARLEHSEKQNDEKKWKRPGPRNAKFPARSATMVFSLLYAPHDGIERQKMQNENSSLTYLFFSLSSLTADECECVVFVTRCLLQQLREISKKWYALK